VPGRAQVAEEKATALPADLARVPPGAVWFLTFRAADLWGGELGKAVREKAGPEAREAAQELEKRMGVNPGQIERLTLVALAVQGEPVVLVRTVKPYDRARVLTALVPRALTRKHKGLTVRVNEKNQALCLLDRQHFVFGPTDTVLAFLEKDDVKKEPGLRPALAAATKGHAAVIGLNPPAFLREVGSELPEEAIKPYKPLLNTRTAVLTVDMGPLSRAQLRLSFAGAAEAKSGEKALGVLVKLGQAGLERGIKELGKDKSMAAVLTLLQKVEEGLKKATVKQDGSEVVAALEVKSEPATLAGLLSRAVVQVRQAALRISSMNNLKQLGIAMHNYHDVTGSFPTAAVYDAAGKPLLSWRVMLLPYIEQDALYREFRLDEAWDSPHNKKLLAKMPKLYADVTGKAPPNTTYYQGFVGPGAIFDGKRGIRIPVDIPDGTSNTFMFVEAGKPVPWSKPEDVPYDPKKPVPKLGGIFGGAFNAGLCDGSVRFFRKPPPEKILRLFIERNDGMPIPNFDE
jgi:hypothetical protein